MSERAGLADATAWVWIKQQRNCSEMEKGKLLWVL